MRSASGSVQEIQRGKLYRVVVEYPRDPMTGKRRQVTRNVRGSRKKAERVKAELLIKSGRPEASQARISMDVFFTTVYLPWARANRRPRTVYGYESEYYRLIQPAFGDTALDMLTPLTINQWLQTLTPGRAHSAWKMLRALLNRAVKMGFLARSPLINVDEPRTPRYEPEVLTLEESRAYLYAYRGTDIEPAVLVIMGCGTTRSETVALNWEDITPDGVVNIDDGITQEGGKIYHDAPKNVFRYRTIHLPKSIASRLNELRPDDMYTRDGDDTLAPKPLCTGRTGTERISPDRLSRRFRAIQENLPEDVKRISLKNLRHTSLTLTVESGADLLAVSRRAGHSTTAITARYYLRPHDEVDIDTAQKLDNLFAHAAGNEFCVTGCDTKIAKDSDENKNRPDD